MYDPNDPIDADFAKLIASNIKTLRLKPDSVLDVVSRGRGVGYSRTSLGEIVMTGVHAGKDVLDFVMSLRDVAPHLFDDPAPKAPPPSIDPKTNKLRTDSARKAFARANLELINSQSIGQRK